MAKKTEEGVSLKRRNFLRGSLSLIPVVTLGGLGVPLVATATTSRADSGENGNTSPARETTPYRPTFFSPTEWAFINAACDRLIPADNVGPGALELGVPEFIDRHMQTPYAKGAIWYMQGPFKPASADFGYQGRLPLCDILKTGIAAMNKHCTATFQGKAFAELTHEQQETLLKEAESGKLELDGISSKTFFSELLNETRNGYFSDPSHGGNKGMGSWKMIGYPGMRADYIDWVTVRDKPYPIPPVDLNGNRG